ncbi:hypothetical protein HDU67_003260 [Dinochytrium kinnereticum]|nr:hypothetical protein HDU67_003260 [Dinochytrium kinnereticum]
MASDLKKDDAVIAETDHDASNGPPTRLSSLDKEVVSLDFGIPVLQSQFHLLLKVHGHPFKGVDDSGKKTLIRPARPIIVDDEFRMAQFKFNINKLITSYPIKWVPGCTKEKLVNTIIKKATDINGLLYNPDDEIELLRLRWCDLGLTLPFRTDLAIHAVESYTNFLNEDSTNRNLTASLSERWEEWYVVFSDSRMFVYSHTDRFASEEINCVEHLVLGNVKEALNDLSTNGIFTEPEGYARRYQALTGRFAGYNPLQVNDPDFYLPKDKNKEDFRHENIGPFTRDSAHRPTPYILMDVPLVCKINPGKFYGPKFKEFPEEALKKITSDVKTYQPSTTTPFTGTHDGYAQADPTSSTPTLRKRITNNLVVMSSLDQLFNPLRARIGPYTVYQIRFIFRTAYTAFHGLMATTRRNSLEKKQKKWTPKVILHTGFWGCGSFGGNKTVMAYLQMVAASAAGVDELHMHCMPRPNELEPIATAKRWFMEDIVTGVGLRSPVEEEVGSARFEEAPESVIKETVKIRVGDGKGTVDLDLEKLFRNLEAKGEKWEEAL